MTARHATELLYDSEAALRLVDSAIEDLRSLPRTGGTAADPTSNADLRRAVEQLHQTHDKLREVTNATQVAATDILDGLDRAVALVDDMDAKAKDGDAVDGADLRNKLRDELFALMGCMQFQDITKQQLTYASSVLTEVESQLARLATILHR